MSTPRPAAIAAKLRITVLRGGPSAERAVSLESGRAIAEALRRRGHEVHEADIGPDDLSALERAADVVFPALHGPFGEDGAVQKIMERRGMRFVGSGSRASALAMDKVAVKPRALELAILTPEYELLTCARKPGLAPPVVVKPVDQGSSVATHIVRDAGGVLEAVQDVLGRFGRALVERFIAGSEITVGILGRQTLPPIWVRPRREFYDYQAKYHDEATEYAFDTGLPPGVLEELARQSLRIFGGLGCRHLARVDWIVDSHRRPWLLEINTIPGFTSHSLVPKAAARAGVPFDELCERLVRMALE